MFSVDSQYKSSKNALEDVKDPNPNGRHYPRIMRLWNDIREGHVNKVGIILAVIAVWSISINYGIGL